MPLFSARGVCWNTTGSPTISDDKTMDGTVNGSFMSSITGLTESTTYYARAYATNNVGTSYGNEETFTTASSWACGDPFTDARDGNLYETVAIGGQCWMAENLAYLPSVFPSSTGSETTVHNYVYGYEGTDVSAAKATANYASYGVLYNWGAAKTVCPDGWRLPSDEEWKTLEKHLGMSETDADILGLRLIGAVGRKLKSTSGWLNNGNGDNSSGFNALPGGDRISGGGFYFLGIYADFWSSTENGPSDAWYRALSYVGDGVSRFSLYRSSGLSVRYLKN